jgi:hypothetical protein
VIASRRLDQQLFTQFVTSKAAVFLDSLRVRLATPLCPPSNILNKHCCTWSSQSKSKFLSFPISFTRQSIKRQKKTTHFLPRCTRTISAVFSLAKRKRTRRHNLSLLLLQSVFKRIFYQECFCLQQCFALRRFMSLILSYQKEKKQRFYFICSTVRSNECQIRFALYSFFSFFGLM